MRPIIAITMLLGLAARATYATPCPEVPVAPGGGGDGMGQFSAAVACSGGGGGGGGGVVRCPVNFPVPTNATVCACKTSGRDTNVRCNGGLSQSACNGMTANALAIGLITADAQSWLTANSWCPVVIAGALTDLCPMGCFDADTPILTAMSADGDPSYTPAGELAPHTPLLTMSDESGLDAVDLVPRTVSRVVHGPEDPPLFAFALSNGTTLRVTAHHAMVLDSGVIVAAEDVQPGAAFAGADGQPVKVAAITREPATGDVFNYETTGDSQLSKVMVADGVLVGGLKLQNELSAEEKLIALRR